MPADKARKYLLGQIQIHIRTRTNVNTSTRRLNMWKVVILMYLVAACRSRGWTWKQRSRFRKNWHFSYLYFGELPESDWQFHSKKRGFILSRRKAWAHTKTFTHTMKNRMLSMFSLLFAVEWYLSKWDKWFGTIGFSFFDKLKSCEKLYQAHKYVFGHLF